MVEMTAESNYRKGGAPIMITDGFDSESSQMDEHKTLSSKSRRTPLEGIFQRFGKTLPCVERVSGELVILEFSPTVINGMLLNGPHTIRVRFESNARGPLAELRQFIESSRSDPISQALCNAGWPAKVSGRPWVKDDGSIVLLIRSFSMNLPSVGQTEESP